ncbi:nucleoside phosphorylase domain-containing protein [Trichoderma ceciliae]
MSDPGDYTIGWICATTVEYVAARAFIDETHDGPEYISPHDNNYYTLGRMAEHNVVIAVLPDGEYGMVSAAVVARDMLHSFPNIRIGLSVGVGGGAPSRKHDIRLGDVVVGIPQNGMGGVFQYDYGKMIQGQSFQTMGFLNQPPVVLRTAVDSVRRRHDMQGNGIDEAINSILEKKPRLRKKYGRPEPGSDRLFKAEMTHDSACAADSETCSDDPSNWILRSKREDEDDPAIHYGLVASGNSLMRDAFFRDRLGVANDVLCFEMEAAGLMNHFPCLAIRGICDYSDSHTNRNWQGYASMTAAAFAKDLLQVIQPNPIKAVMSDLAAIQVRDTIQGIRDIFNKPLSDPPLPASGDLYITWLLNLWEPRRTIGSLRDLLSPQKNELGTEENFLTEHIDTELDDSDLISLVYDRLPTLEAEKEKNQFHVVVRKYSSNSPAWSQQPCSLFRDPILRKVEKHFDIPPGCASAVRDCDGGSCISFHNDQTCGYIIQTPFYNKFEGFWSLFINWSKVDAHGPETQCSRVLAILEANGDLPREILLDVHRLSKDHRHPVYLLTCLLEQHIEDSVVKFKSITGRIAEVERTLREDLNRPQDINQVDKTLQTHRNLSAALHNCSIGVVDLEKRRHFEKKMSSHVNELIQLMLKGYDNNRPPQACVDLKQRMDLFNQIATSRDLDIESLPRRISTQMNVLYNQIAQRDAWVNLDIARGARDDNVVMVQDSNAMKTIAVLTTLFLPGTFIAVRPESATTPRSLSANSAVPHEHLDVQLCRR